MSSKPTAQQRDFCRQYLIDGNGTQAAIRAGYSEASAASQASELLRIPKVRDYLAQLAAKRAAKLDLRADEILRGIKCIAEMDPLDFFDADGSPLPLEQVPEDARRALVGMKVTLEANQLDDGPRTLARVAEYKFESRLGAYEKLAKHLGLLKETVKVEHTGTLEHVLAKARARREAKAKK